MSHNFEVALLYLFMLVIILILLAGLVGGIYIAFSIFKDNDDKDL